MVKAWLIYFIRLALWAARRSWRFIKAVPGILIAAYRIAREREEKAVRAAEWAKEDETEPPPCSLPWEQETQAEIDDLQAEISDYWYLLDCATERFENAGRQETAEKAKRQMIAYRKAIAKLEKRIEQLEQGETI